MKTCKTCEYYYAESGKCCNDHPTKDEPDCEKMSSRRFDATSMTNNAKNQITKQDFCVFNTGIQCLTNERVVMNCATCGWNPLEQERRKNK